MQLIEYIVWSNYDDKQINFVASIAAASLLWLQPVASIFTLSGSWIPTLLSSYIALLIVGIFLGIYTPIDKYKMYRGVNGHLVWNWLQNDWKTGLSLLVYFIFLLVPPVLTKNWVLLSLGISTLLLSVWTFHKDNTWGSMWCWIVNYGVVGLCAKQIFLTPK